MRTGHGIRRMVLERLYHVFRDTPYEPKSVSELLSELELDEHTEAEWNLSYLEQKGLITIDFISVGEGGVGKFAKVTTEGIDIVENPVEFDRLFPEAGRTESVLRLIDSLRDEMAAVDMSDEDKKAIFDSLERLSDRPDAADALMKAILKTFFGKP